MSTGTTNNPPFTVGTALYRYIVVAALSIVVVIAAMLCWRSRVMERRIARQRLHISPGQIDTGQNKARPILYDVYLGRHGDLWHTLMPISMQQLLHPTQVRSSANSGKSVSPADNQTCSRLTLALLVEMPAPPINTREVEDENAPFLPYLEFGIKDVECPSGSLDSGQ
ncbi:hypothetical protein R3P38DRAFT_2873589 [Favolaschia claudopus]|uniref:Uncharacterized protein n=1 Tax=Favolaschia claudopus TaxID=2862362 RepID=A0AAW0D1R8_9AGAR